jgi:hypothetical protein
LRGKKDRDIAQQLGSFLYREDAAERRTFLTSPSSLPAALARGDVDAVSIWEPAAEQSAKALGPDALILQGPEGAVQSEHDHGDAS